MAREALHACTLAEKDYCSDQGSYSVILRGRSVGPAEIFDKANRNQIVQQVGHTLQNATDTVNSLVSETSFRSVHTERHIIQYLLITRICHQISISSMYTYTNIHRYTNRYIWYVELS